MKWVINKTDEGVELLFENSLGLRVVYAYDLYEGFEFDHNGIVAVPNSRASYTRLRTRLYVERDETMEQIGFRRVVGGHVYTLYKVPLRKDSVIRGAAVKIGRKLYAKLDDEEMELDTSRYNDSPYLARVVRLRKKGF